jgi:hypothetical protein
MMTTYEENILQKYADDLYQQAKWIVFWTAVRYGAGVFLFRSYWASSSALSKNNSHKKRPIRDLAWCYSLVLWESLQV